MIRGISRYQAPLVIVPTLQQVGRVALFNATFAADI